MLTASFRLKMLLALILALLIYNRHLFSIRDNILLPLILALSRLANSIRAIIRLFRRFRT